MTCYNDNASRTYAHEQGLEADYEEALNELIETVIGDHEKLTEILDNEQTATWFAGAAFDAIKLTTQDQLQAYEIAHQIVIDYCERNFDDYIEQQRRLHNEY
jgi:hypothetical protein